MNNNLPISYDFHGDIPFSEPFKNIKPSDIHIYLDLDTYIGRNTCGQACHHCWFVNYKKVFKKRFEPSEGIKIYRALTAEGFKVFPRYTDSFAYDGELMKLYSTANARTYFADDKQETKTMSKGEAWTSGRPLLNSNYKELLDIAREHNYGTITITYHGILDENLDIIDANNYPIKGVLLASDFEKVLNNIQEYNRLNQSKDFEGFRVGAGVTIGTHNNSLEMLKRYSHYFNKIGISVLRLNKFFDHGNRHPHLVLSENKVKQLYKDIKWIHTNLDLKFQFGVSEDVGTMGIEALELPSHVGWCRAGRQLFAIIPTQKESVFESDENFHYEIVGDLVGCVNIFEPVVGTLIRQTNITSNSVSYKIDFYYDEIEKLTKKRLDGTYKNGCFSRELMDEIQVTVGLNMYVKNPLKI